MSIQNYSEKETAKFTTNLDRRLLKQVKLFCIEQEITVREFIEEAMLKYHNECLREIEEMRRYGSQNNHTLPVQNLI